MDNKMVDIRRRIFAWFVNANTFHHRIMMRYLRKRGWVVFYLEGIFRECNGDTCWMKLYKSELQKEVNNG